MSEHAADAPERQEQEGRRNTRLRFEQWVKNARCESNAVAAILGVSMAEVARREGLPPTMGQSPFAIARGKQFEASLFKEDAKRLREALADSGVPLPKSASLRDLRIRLNGGGLHTLDEAFELTQQLLREAAAGGAQQGLLVPSATVKLPGSPPMLPEAMLVLDVLLVLSGTPPRLVVGEVKTYPDRHGHTDRGELATARAQAGVYVHALREVLAAMGLDGKLEVYDQGFLVLTKPMTNFPSVRAGEDLRFQAERAERGLVRLRERATALAADAGALKDRIGAVLAAPCSYVPSCVSFCDRATGCQERALAAGDPIVLGEDVARFASGVTLDRIAALLQGGKAGKPRDEAERVLLIRIQEAKGGLE